ncbi:deleted in malignant brain tumors 1 protein-like, partial [Stylophora pistillata]|uniref:deleted in malignant brain tumors 1 protein-like n=1 Tax=Stylophora pistillata TaxID=50429 RepID=UPI000C052997
MHCPSTIVEGSTVTLLCNATGNPSPNITWIWQNIGLVLGRNGNLTITEVDRSQTGTYLCRAWNGIGSNSTKRCSLDVFFETHVQALQCPSSVTEGSSVNLQCTATGNPLPNITWIWKDTGDVLGGYEQLILVDVQRNQAGSYQCFAWNGIGNSSTNTCHLDVFHLPTGTSMTSGLNDTIVLAGDNLFLNCTSDANPAVYEFQLTFESTLIATSSSGMFSVSVKKAGKYTCFPVNVVGSGDNATVKVTVLVRLVGPTNSPSSGRVEVFYNGTWGTICDDLWDLQDADVVCRQLGYDGALSAPGDAKFGQGTGPTWLDDVQCVGDETFISQCNHKGWGNHNCGHYSDASVLCKPKVVRLLNANNSPSSGRVEVLYNGTWGGICGRLWDQQDADVVCRQLGYDGALSATTGTAFGKGTILIWLDYVNCVGNELSLTQCNHRGWGVHSCGRNSDAGVVCQPRARLVSPNTSSSSGRVEVFYNGTWGTICDDYWDLKDADVVCRQLGYEEALSARGITEFRQGKGQIWLDDVKCVGNETTIVQCRHRGWAVHNCGHSKDAGVMCRLPAVRLVKFSLPSSGRVEVLHNGKWGTICDHYWDKQDADVVCRQLGYDGALGAVRNAAFGQGTGQIWLDDVQCKGDELSISDCIHLGWGAHNCRHNHDAGVVCRPAVRLVSSTHLSSSGRVEVFYNGTWGTICDDYWDLREADVICRQLGYDGALSAPGDAAFGQGTGQIWLDDVECVGHETVIAQCNHKGWGIHNCGHYSDASVVCRPKAVRIVKFSLPSSGRVEVLHNGKWGTICDDYWNKQDADVVCHQLGYDGALRAVGNAAFGQGTGQIWLDDVQCKGDELSISDCTHSGWGAHNCYHHDDAGVVCRPAVRLVSRTNSPSSGRVEVFYDGSWGTICDNSWDLREADVICRQLGYDGALSAPGDAAFGRGTGQIWLDEVKCEGYETVIAQCNHKGWGIRSCGHYSDASVVCRPKGYDGALRAVGNAAFGQGTGQIWLDDVQCKGDELSISDCTHSGWGAHNCYHHDDAGVVCRPAVRLVSRTNSPSSGRVEVFYDGSWGTICDNSWDLREADVICRQLGYDGALSAPGDAAFGRGTGQIWLDEVKCEGYETVIAQCNHKGWGIRSCGHYSDASVVCRPKAVRIVKFSLPSSGRVEVLHNGKWGTICDHYWNKQDADVVCHQLGYDGALRAVGNAAFGQGTGQIWLDDVQCKGDELSISDCTHSGWGAHNCYHRDDAGIVCRPAVRLVSRTNSPSSGRVEVFYDGFRLASPNDAPFLGRVEVHHSGTWGTICGDYWDLKDADVVCNQLGYDGAFSAPRSAVFGEGTGPIWLNRVWCRGDEKSVSQCSHAGWAGHNCGHDKDAGVVCRQIKVEPQIVNLQCPGSVVQGSNVTLYCNVTGNPSPNITWIWEDTGEVLGRNEELTFSAVKRSQAGNYQCLAWNGIGNMSTKTCSLDVFCDPLVLNFECPTSVIEGYDATLHCNATGNPLPNITWIQQDTKDVLGTTKQLTLTAVNRNKTGTFQCIAWNGIGNNSTRTCTLDVFYEPLVLSLECPTPIVEGHDVTLHCNATGNPLPNISWIRQDTGDTLGTNGQLTLTAVNRSKTGTFQCLAWNGIGNNSTRTCSLDVYYKPLVLNLECPISIIEGYDATVHCSATGNPLPNITWIQQDTKDVLSTNGQLTLTAVNRSKVGTLQCVAWNGIGNNSTRTCSLDVFFQPQIFDIHCPATIVEGSNITFHCNATGNPSPNITWIWQDKGYVLGRSENLTLTEVNRSQTGTYLCRAWNGIGSNSTRTCNLDLYYAPGFPVFVNNTVNTITIRWSPIYLQSVTYTVNVRREEETAWMNITCKTSNWKNHCIVTQTVAKVVGLEEVSVYHLRVYANYRGVRSDASLPSGAFRTAALAELALEQISVMFVLDFSG